MFKCLIKRVGLAVMMYDGLFKYVLVTVNMNSYDIKFMNVVLGKKDFWLMVHGSLIIFNDI